MSDLEIETEIGVDDEVDLDTLLSERDRSRLQQYAEAFLEAPVCLSDLEGRPLFGRLPATDEQSRVPLSMDFEPLGFLHAPVPEARLKGLARLVEWALSHKLKYLMASTLHAQAVQADYQALQQRNQELQASEARYRALAAELEQRVAAQVKTIKDAERQLYEREKLASVGFLAAGVAHEINNPIGFMTSNLHAAQEYIEELKGYNRRLQMGESLSQSECDELDELYRDFDDLLAESLDGCQRVTAIVKNLKDFSQVDASEIAPVNINQLIETVYELFRSQLPEGLSVILKLSDLPEIRGNAGHLSQVFYNLFSNAVDALKGNDLGRPGRICFATRRGQSKQGDPQILIKVSDNGPGMSDEVRKNSFLPFYTTKPVGQGTGLGLAVCRDIVQAHSGEIELQSVEGVGSQFSIRLPLVNDL